MLSEVQLPFKQSNAGFMCETKSAKMSIMLDTYLKENKENLPPSDCEKLFKMSATKIIPVGEFRP